MSPPQHATRTRKAIIVIILIIAVTLCSTVILLGSVSYFLAIPSAAFLSEGEIPWDQSDAIPPIRDLDTMLSGDDAGRYYMRSDWDGRVLQTESWDRLYDITPREGEKIPRLIHQTWKTDTLPPQWQDAWRECREGMPDYEYMLWTDDLSREFIQKYYPDFLPTFDGYQYPIQRADSIRYFILHHFGGIYMDLDIGCRRRMDPLLKGDWEVILPITKPVGVSNDLLFSSRGSRFMETLIEALPCFDNDWIVNYPTVMFSTGPMFLSAVYAVWNSNNPITIWSPRSPVRILPKSLYGKNALPQDTPHSFFSHFYGSSWHDDDAGFFWFLADHGTTLLIFCGIMVLLAALRLVWIRRRIAAGYTPLGLLPTTAPSSSMSDLSSFSTPAISPPSSPKLEAIQSRALGLGGMLGRAASHLIALPTALLGRSHRRYSSTLPTILVTRADRNRRSSEMSGSTLVDASLASPLLRSTVSEDPDEKVRTARARSSRSASKSEPSSGGTGGDGMEEVDAFLKAYGGHGEHGSKEK